MLLALATALLPISARASAIPGPAAGWRDVDRLRDLLEATGTRVLQRDCPQRNLQGLFQHASGTIVICRVHRDPAEVWNTLAHEATHRMQACAGGSLTRPELHASMARTLAAYAPEEFRALRLYRPAERLSELEARYTARLPPDQVLALYRRYCGAPRTGSLSSSPR
ncbi:hypothetical protein NZK32_16030 [Cyanobium sp. FGCU-52]|nr:hypothetical protein [Cyanobium sp. FGCU52]